MKIFLSYASEDKSTAEQVQLTLVGCGHDVFFDETSLPPAGDYNSKIREAIFSSDLFIFLISPDAVVKSAYALTELKFAREKWPHPKNRILPVLVRPTDFTLIPNYLKAVTVLEPSGNVAAEVSYWVSKRGNSRPRWVKFGELFLEKRIIVVLLGITVTVAFISFFPFSKLRFQEPISLADCRFYNEYTIRVKLTNPTDVIAMVKQGIIKVERIWPLVGISRRAYVLKSVSAKYRVKIPLRRFPYEIPFDLTHLLPKGEADVFDIELEAKVSREEEDLREQLKLENYSWVGGDLRTILIGHDFILQIRVVLLCNKEDTPITSEPLLYAHIPWGFHTVTNREKNIISKLELPEDQKVRVHKAIRDAEQRNLDVHQELAELNFRRNGLVNEILMGIRPIPRSHLLKQF